MYVDTHSKYHCNNIVVFILFFISMTIEIYPISHSVKSCNMHPTWLISTIQLNENVEFRCKYEYTYYKHIFKIFFLNYRPIVKQNEKCHNVYFFLAEPERSDPNQVGTTQTKTVMKDTGATQQPTTLSDGNMENEGQPKENRDYSEFYAKNFVISAGTLISLALIWYIVKETRRIIRKC